MSQAEQAPSPLYPALVSSSLDCEAFTCLYSVPQFLQLSWEGSISPQGSKHQPVSGSLYNVLRSCHLTQDNLYLVWKDPGTDWYQGRANSETLSGLPACFIPVWPKGLGLA